MDNNEDNLNNENDDSISSSFENDFDETPEESLNEAPNEALNESTDEVRNETLNEAQDENEVSQDILKEDVEDDSIVEDFSDIDNATDSKNIEAEFSFDDVDDAHNIDDSSDFCAGEDSKIDESLVTVRPVRFQQFNEAVLNLSIKKNLDIMQDIPMHITVELGRTKSTIKDIVNMDIGSIVELDKIAGEQVEIFVNEKLVARGEVIVIEDKFGVRVVNVNIPKEIV